jgi:flagellar biosynthesis anti-sigma factor FlgM
MKINNDGLGALSNRTQGLERTTADKADQKPRSGATSGDALTLSSDAQFLQAATELASGAPAVRQDVVDRMKKLLEEGKVGNDAGALADAIIDDMLPKP